jgi:hypothetical protein
MKPEMNDRNKKRRELIPTFSIHPEAASPADVAWMAAELMECRGLLFALGVIDKDTGDMLRTSLKYFAAAAVGDRLDHPLLDGADEDSE